MLRLLVGTRFQVLLFPSRGASHLSLTVLVHYRSLGVFSLREWSPWIHAEFHGFRITRVPSARLNYFAYRTFTFYGSSFQRDSTTIQFGNWPAGFAPYQDGPTTPIIHRRKAVSYNRFRLIPFRSPLLGESLRFLLLRLLRCFSSAACLYLAYIFSEE